LDTQMRAPGREQQGRTFRYIGQTGYPLGLIAYGGIELLLRLEYSRQHFEDGVAQRLLQYFTTVLGDLASSAESRRLATLTLLPADEKLALNNLGRAVASRPASAPLQVLFEEQARRHADRIAVSCAGQALSYGELNARANQLAHRLRDLGAGPDVL